LWKSLSSTESACVFRNKDEFKRSLPASYDGEFAWDFLPGAFPRGIMPMDIDAIVEINDHFLIFETKSPGATVPTGQRRTIQALLRIDTISVWFLEGKNEIEFRRAVFAYLDCRYSISGRPEQIRDVVFKMCQRWSEYVLWSHTVPHRVLVDAGFRPTKVKRAMN
jgi:hypothetical protein